MAPRRLRLASLRGPLLFAPPPPPLRPKSETRQASNSCSPLPSPPRCSLGSSPCPPQAPPLSGPRPRSRSPTPSTPGSSLAGASLVHQPSPRGQTTPRKGPAVGCSLPPTPPGWGLRQDLGAAQKARGSVSAPSPLAPGCLAPAALQGTPVQWFLETPSCSSKRKMSLCLIPRIVHRSAEPLRGAGHRAGRQCRPPVSFAGKGWRSPGKPSSQNKGASCSPGRTRPPRCLTKGEAGCESPHSGHSEPGHRLTPCSSVFINLANVQRALPQKAYSPRRAVAGMPVFTWRTYGGAGCLAPVVGGGGREEAWERRASLCLSFPICAMTLEGVQGLPQPRHCTACVCARVCVEGGAGSAGRDHSREHPVGAGVTLSVSTASPRGARQREAGSVSRERGGSAGWAQPAGWPRRGRAVSAWEGRKKKSKLVMLYYFFLWQCSESLQMSAC